MEAKVKNDIDVATTPTISASRADMQGWTIYLPDGRKMPYSLENLSKVL